MIVVQINQPADAGCAQQIRVRGLAVRVFETREIVSHDGYALFEDDGRGRVSLVDWTGRLRVQHQPEPLQLVPRFLEAAWDIAYEHSLKDDDHVSKKLPVGSRWWVHQDLLPVWWDPRAPRIPRDSGPRPRQPPRAQVAITHHSCSWTSLLLSDGTQYSSQSIQRPRADEILPFVAGEHGDPIPDATIAAVASKLRRQLPEHRVDRAGA